MSLTDRGTPNHVDENDRSPSTTVAESWGTPESIDRNDRRPLPESAERFPGAVWSMVNAVGEAYQVPRDLVLMLVLSILSTAVGGRRRVRVSPDWVEVLAVYTATALPSGERKSPVLSILSTPLAEAERDLVRDAMPEITTQQALRDLRTAAVEKLKRKGDTSATAIADLEDAITALEKTVVPAVPRLLADDSTPEAMARLMADQGGRLGVLSAEGGLFSTLAGRYSSGIPNLDLVLKAWSGDPCRIDRISRATLTLPEPVLSIGLAVQPDILASLAEAKHFRGSGLLARFLYSLPQSLVGTRNPDPQPVPDQVNADYILTVDTLVRSLRDTDPADMKLTDAARAVLTAFRIDLEPRLHPEYGDLAGIADWANKLPGQLVRIAALFTLAVNPAATDVDEIAITEAVSLAPYLIDHATAAFDLMTGRRSPLEPARAVLRWIRKKRHSSFTIRQAHRDLAGQKWVTTADDVQEALEDLEDLGWVRLAQPPEVKGRGRPPSPRYEVHPHAHPEGVTR